MGHVGGTSRLVFVVTRSVGSRRRRVVTNLFTNNHLGTNAHIRARVGLPSRISDVRFSDNAVAISDRIKGNAAFAIVLPLIRRGARCITGFATVRPRTAHRAYNPNVQPTTSATLLYSHTHVQRQSHHVGTHQSAPLTPSRRDVQPSHQYRTTEGRTVQCVYPTI